MDQSWLERFPPQVQDAAREAVTSAFGSTPILSVDPVSGGASGALAYRLGVRNRFYLLRIEAHRGPNRNPHQYECMRIASEAGVAPPLRYFSDPAGVSIMDFIGGHPLTSYPGGQVPLLKALGRLAADLQGAAPFPVLMDYRVFVGLLLDHLKTFFAPGLLDEHLESFKQIRSAYPWSPDEHVSSHNDPNPHNIVFDGVRLWLVDWETACRNDRLIDIAILANNHASTPELEEILLTSLFDSTPDRLTVAKVKLMRQLTRLYYAGLLVAFAGKPAEPVADLIAPTPDEFRAQIARGELELSAIQARVILAKMCLTAVQSELRAPAFSDALKVCRAG